MGDFWNKLFGPEKKPGPRQPSPGAGTGVATTTTRHRVEATAEPAPIPRVEDVGEPVVARLVDPSASDFKILGRAKLYAPGDTVRFFVQALSIPQRLEDDSFGPSVPVPGLPVEVHNKAQARQLGESVVTDEQGVAIIPYVVTDEDMSGDMSDDVPDSGSHICVAYVGGRLLNRVVVLWDIA